MNGFKENKDSTLNSKRVSSFAARLAMEFPSNQSSSYDPLVSWISAVRENYSENALGSSDNDKQNNDANCEALVVFNDEPKETRYSFSTGCARLSYMKSNGKHKDSLNSNDTHANTINRIPTRSVSDKALRAKSDIQYPLRNSKPSDAEEKENIGSVEIIELQSDDEELSSHSPEIMSDAESCRISLMDGLSSMENGYPVDDQGTFIDVEPLRYNPNDDLKEQISYYQDYTDKYLLNETIMNWEEREPTITEVLSRKYLEDLASRDHRSGNKPFFFT
ncbi:Schizosaccharomyces specific protein Mug125 [Schizosaccharomyces osmophilus]|uniref:Schizosaccharomyces specific protein Mug125 n=1 Tax=Schizosaccharomyces osmophilus TaxID=2545709 RepID=A0AAE9W833_9SCHI|nr:Schizosaccharomyces specific protein Mug125 [Schizosaccharomyces osmophilus]WBW71505.1 Schizosaccharomyces specific protein Mug125 [Schizosaccharomyces osmophilus]